MNQKLTFTVLCFGLSLTSSAFAQNTITLDQYLDQVRGSNAGYKGSQMLSKGSAQASEEAEQLIKPQLFVNATKVSDQKQTLQPAFQGSRTDTTAYSLGLMQTTSFGLSGKLYYSLNEIDIQGSALSMPKFSTGSPVIELSQSLLRNGFGRELQATQELVKSSSLSNSYAEAFKAKARIFEAEATYWRLALARESVTIQKGVHERAKKILEWAQRRAKMNLGDEADFLQANAAYAGRQLELQGAIDEERAAARSFNLSRQIDSDLVPEKLDGLTPDRLLAMKAPVKKSEREDLKAAEFGARAAKANSEVAREKNGMTLDLVGSYALNSREVSTSDAISKSWGSEHPYTMIGVKFSMPLDISTMNSTREGRALEAQGADLSYQRKALETQNEWQDQTAKFGEALKKLELALQFEALQKKKADYERTRLLRGRTTTFQVLNFEQDLASAEINRLRLQTEVLRLAAQLKLFGGEL